MNEDTDFQDTAQKEEKYQRFIFTISEKQEILILHNLPQIEHIYYKIDFRKKVDNFTFLDLRWTPTPDVERDFAV